MGVPGWIGQKVIAPRFNAHSVMPMPLLSGW
jgi:hypothetical protein